MTTAQPSRALAVIHKDAILERIAQGKRLSDISEELGLGITRNAISKALKADPSYRQCYELGLESVLEQREREMELASEQVDVARARELLAQARWRAEREFPERWGQKANANVTIDLGSALQMLSERMQERAATQLPQCTTVNNESDAVQVIESKQD